MTGQFEILESADDGAQLLCVRGELDIATAPQLSSRLRALLEQRSQIVLDLSELSFLDSTGIAVLITAARAADDDGASFAIRALSPNARRVLELSGVVDRLHVLPGQP